MGSTRQLRTCPPQVVASSCVTSSRTALKIIPALYGHSEGRRLTKFNARKHAAAAASGL